MFDNHAIAYLLFPAMVGATFSQLINWRINRDVPGVAWWSLGLALQTFGIGIRAGDLHLPFDIDVVITNILVVGGQFVLLLGLCRFSNRPMFTAAAFVTMLLLVIGVSFFTIGQPDIAIRTLIFALGSAVPIGLQFSLLPPIARREGATGVIVLMTAYCLTILVILLRAAALAMLGDHVLGNMHLGDNPTLIGRQAIASLGATLLGTAYAFGYVLLVANRTRWRLEQIATIDSLTGAANRRAFDAELPRAVARARRAGTRLGLALMDLDRFKQLNDANGHEAGDAMLHHFADLVRAGMRETDFFARVGGEEFALLLPDTDIDSAELAADRIRAALEASSLVLPEGSLRGTVSIGVAVTAEAGAGYERLYAAADEALYRAKERGRNCVERSQRHGTTGVVVPLSTSGGAQARAR